jgi:hypothetical protein
MDEEYEIRVLGFLGPGLRTTFDSMCCEVVPRQTTIRGRLSVDELQNLLELLDQLGMEVIRLDCFAT